MSLDTDILDARFRTVFPTSDTQVLTLNKPPGSKADENRPWVRYMATQGARGRATNGVVPRYLNMGSIFLQVMVPKRLGISAGDELVKRFVDLFCDWQSPDGALLVGAFSQSMAEEDKLYVLRLRYSWQSERP